MDRQAVLAAFDEQIRQRPRPETAEGYVEYDGKVVRSISVDGGWHGVTWCDVNQSSADAVIAAQIARFDELPGGWEWKHYSYDQPPDLATRLVEAGFTPEPAETLLVAEIAELTLDVPPPADVELRVVTDRLDIEGLVSVHDRVFGGDYSALGNTVLAGLERRPCTASAVLALSGNTPVAAGRVEFHIGTEFASLVGWRHSA